VAEFSVLAPKDAGISSVSELRVSLLAVMDKAGPGDTIILDLSKLASADSSLAQLIIAFRHEARVRNQTTLIEGEDSKHSVSALLGCDVVCEACTFNDFRTRVDSGPGSGTPEVKAKPGVASRTKGAKA
jgi:ABC-type transporter Mla MlaB component